MPLGEKDDESCSYVSISKFIGEVILLRFLRQPPEVGKYQKVSE
jgi:hypothetical protein